MRDRDDRVVGWQQDSFSLNSSLTAQSLQEREIKPMKLLSYYL